MQDHPLEVIYIAAVSPVLEPSPSRESEPLNTTTDVCTHEPVCSRYQNSIGHSLLNTTSLVPNESIHIIRIAHNNAEDLLGDVGNIVISHNPQTTLIASGLLL